jgi:predicted metal-dependent phosphoesterase TrpH
MAKRSPFTALCRQFARLSEPRRADLHTHTTASDGAYTASQVVALARQAGLAAVAVTDHDTLAAVPEAIAAAASLPQPGVEVIPGVEITTHLDGRELHLLAYFVDPGHPELAATLARTRDRRRDRFRDYLARLAGRGLAVPDDRARLVEAATPSLGRRHVAGLLVACGFARSPQEAFHRLLGRLHGEVTPKDPPAIGDVIPLVHDAGGVTSLAHPPAEFGDAEFRTLRGLGLDAVEAVYPWGRSSQVARLRDAASRHGLLVTGGSDCHGPTPVHRTVGSYAVTSEELDRLRGRCGRPVGAC